MFGVIVGYFFRTRNKSYFLFLLLMAVPFFFLLGSRRLLILLQLIETSRKNLLLFLFFFLFFFQLSLHIFYSLGISFLYFLLFVDPLFINFMNRTYFTLRF